MSFFHLFWVQSAASDLGPGLGESEPFMSRFSDPTVLWVLCLTAPLTFKARCFGSLSLKYRSYKLECLVWGSNALLLREKLQVLSSLQIVGHCAGSGVYDEIVSQPLLPTLICFFFFFAQCAVIAQPPFQFFSRGNYFISSFRLKCL